MPPRPKKPTGLELQIPGMDNLPVDTKSVREEAEVRFPVLFPPVEISKGRTITESDYQMIAKHHEIYNAIQESKFCLRKRKCDFDIQSLCNAELYFPNEIYTTSRRKKKVKEEEELFTFETIDGEGAVAEGDENHKEEDKKDEKKEGGDEFEDDETKKPDLKLDDEYDFEEIGQQWDDDDAGGDDDIGDGDDEPTF